MFHHFESFWRSGALTPVDSASGLVVPAERGFGVPIHACSPIEMDCEFVYTVCLIKQTRTS